MKRQTKYAVLIILLVTVYSCKKRDQSGVNFVGTYGGSYAQHGVSKPDTFTINTTSNPNLYIFYNYFDSLYLTMAVNGDSIISITEGEPLAYTGYHGFSTDSVWGYGSLAGNVLQLTLFETYTYTGGSTTDTFSIVTTKI